MNTKATNQQTKSGWAVLLRRRRFRLLHLLLSSLLSGEEAFVGKIQKGKIK
jgi:hypothetical protein